jgi:RNA-binding protein 39
VFVTQLVMRTTERELYKFFRSKGLKTNDITFLRDRRTGKHKGSAYVELRKMEHVATAIGLSGQRPDFQRFPVLIKASEAEKNYVAAPATVPATVPLTLTTTGPVLQQDGTYVQSQKVYVGNLDPAVTQEHLFALFSPFGQLEQVALQTQNGVSKGFAFLQYTDPKSSNLAIQTLQGQMLAGRPLKTGWASQGGGSGVQVVTSTEFPADAVARTQKAYGVLAQLASGQAIVANVAGAATVPSPTAATVSPTARTVVSRIPTVAEARASLAAGTAPSPMAAALSAQQAIPPPPLATSTSSAAAVSPDPKVIGNAANPTQHLLIHNMFDKDEETDPGWELEIAEEFEEECSKFGKILRLTVMHEEAGGKIYASFETVQAAQSCASSLAGRWFDKRQLRVEYVLEQNLPADHKQKLQVSYERR